MLSSTAPGSSTAGMVVEDVRPALASLALRGLSLHAPVNGAQLKMVVGGVCVQNRVAQRGQ